MEAAKIWRQAAGPLLITVWQPPIGPDHLSLRPVQPVTARRVCRPRLRANHNAAGRPVTIAEVTVILKKIIIIK